MSTFVRLLSSANVDEVEPSPALPAEPEFEPEQTQRHLAGWTFESFALDQIRGLVRQLFVPGWPRPCRQVVFSSVDSNRDATSICMQIGQTLSGEASASVCVVETWAGDDFAYGTYGTGLDVGVGEKRFGTLRDLSQQMSSSLWFMPQNIFLGGNESGFSTACLRTRLAELRLEFDYTILHGPPAGAQSEAALLGATCDGVVLVLRANNTRRATAQRVKETLHSANARLLGTVLSERAFPIPSAIYRRL